VQSLNLPAQLMVRSYQFIEISQLTTYCTASLQAQYPRCLPLRQAAMPA